MDLLVHVGTETRGFDVPPAGVSGWLKQWRDSSTLPDAWCASKRISPDVALVEVEVSNASIEIGQKARPMLTGVSVSVESGAGWQLVEGFARPWPTIWPAQRGTWRRYALVKAGAAQETFRRAREFAMGKMRGDWQARAQKFGPADLPLPALSLDQGPAIQSSDGQKLDGLLTALQNGTPWQYEEMEDGLVPRLAPNGQTWGAGKIDEWYPWGPIDPGAPAGAGIQFARGYQQNEKFLRIALLASPCCHERRWLAYRRSDGEPVTADDYGTTSPDYKPGSTQSNGRLPEFSGINNPDPLPVEIDGAHRIRMDGWPIALWEFCDSAMAARQIIGAGEEQRLIASEKGPLPAYGYTPSNFRNALAWATAHVGIGYFGSGWGRQVGWPAWIATMALKVDPARRGLANWLRVYCDISALVAMPSGICQRMHDQSGLWNDATHDACQAFEVGIQKLSEYAANLRLRRPIPPSIVKAAHSLYDPPPLQGGGVIHFPAVADTGGACYPGPLTFGQGAPDAAHIEALIALCYHITGDSYWLDRSALFGAGSPYPTWQAKRDALLKATGLGWQANLLAMYQRASA